MQYIQQFRAAILAMLSGLILTALALALLYNQFSASALLRQKELQLGLAQNLSASLARKEELLRQIQSAFIAQPALSRGQFNQLVLNTNFSIRVPAILAIGFARSVPALSLDQYTLERRSDTEYGAGFYANFQVKTASAEPQILEMISPLNRKSAQWLGEDITNINKTSVGLDLARDTGQAWGSVMSLKGMPEGDVYALYLPIYQRLFDHPSEASLKNNYLGTAIAWLKLSEFLASTERAAKAAGFAIRLIDQGPHDIESAPVGAVLYASKQWPEAQIRAEQVNHHLLNVLGRQWRLEFTTQSGLLHASEMRLLLMLGFLGCVLSALFAFVFQRYAQRNRQLELVVQGQETRQRITFERQSRAMLESIGDPLILRDVSGKIIYANALAEQRFGLDDQTLLGQSQYFFDPAEVGNLAMPVQLTQAHPDRDGIERQYDVMIKPLRNDGLSWVGNVLHARDISAGVALTQALQYKLDRLSELVEVSSDWFWEQDAQARFTYVSGGFFAELDVNPLIFIGKCRWELGTGGLTEAQWDAHRSVLASHKPYRDFEYQAFLNSQVFYFSVSGRPIFAEDGTFAGYRGVGRNVTAMRNAQAALLAEQQRAQATLESIADGVLTTDIHGKIDYINPVASALLGWELEMARGQYLGAVYQSVDVKTRLPLANLVTASLQGGADNQGARRSVLLNKLGLHFQIEESAARIRDEDNRTLGAVLVFRDVSNWREESERVDGF